MRKKGVRSFMGRYSSEIMKWSKEDAFEGEISCLPEFELINEDRRYLYLRFIDTEHESYRPFWWWDSFKEIK
jgi:hypothetical protein